MQTIRFEFSHRSHSHKASESKSRVGMKKIIAECKINDDLPCAGAHCDRAQDQTEEARFQVESVRGSHAVGSAIDLREIGRKSRRSYWKQSDMGQIVEGRHELINIST